MEELSKGDGFGKQGQVEVGEVTALGESGKRTDTVLEGTSVFGQGRSM